MKVIVILLLALQVFCTAEVTALPSSALSENLKEQCDSYCRDGNTNAIQIRDDKIQELEKKISELESNLRTPKRKEAAQGTGVDSTDELIASIRSKIGMIRQSIRNTGHIYSGSTEKEPETTTPKDIK